MANAWEDAWGDSWGDSFGGDAGDGFIAHWKLDETTGTTAVDSVGSYNGTMTGGLTGGDSVPGKVGTALQFDGVGDYVRSAMMQLTYPFTMATWFNLDVAGPSVQTLFVVGDSAADNTYIAIRADNGVLKINRRNATDYPLTGSVAIGRNEWHHVAAVLIDASTSILYVDGVQDAYSDALTSVTVPTINVAILGQLRIPSPVTFLDGSLDDVRLYNRALTAEEIGALIAPFMGSNRMQQLMLT